MKRRSDWQPETGTMPVYHDFQSTDANGDYLLSGGKTGRDIRELGIDLKEGLQINLYCDDGVSEDGRDEVIASGAVRLNADGQWVAHVSDRHVRFLSEVGPYRDE